MSVGDFTRQQLQTANIPLNDGNRNRVGGQAIDPGEDEEVEEDATDAAALPPDEDEILDRDDNEPAAAVQPPPAAAFGNQQAGRPAEIDIDRIADEASAIDISNSPTASFCGSAIMSCSTTVCVAPNLQVAGAPRTFCTCRFDLPGGTMTAEPIQSEDLKGMKFRIQDLPETFDGQVVGADLHPSIADAIDAAGSEELDELEIIDGSPCRLVPITVPEECEPFFVCPARARLGDRRDPVICVSIFGRRIAMVGLVSRRHDVMRVPVAPRVRSQEEILANAAALFGIAGVPVAAQAGINHPMQNHNMQHQHQPIPQAPVPQVPFQPVQQPAAPNQNHNNNNNNELVRQLLQRVQRQQQQMDALNEQQEQQRRNAQLTEMGSNNHRIAQAMAAMPAMTLEGMSQERHQELVAFLTRIGTGELQHPEPQAPPVAAAAAAAAAQPTAPQQQQPRPPGQLKQPPPTQPPVQMHHQHMEPTHIPRAAAVPTVTQTAPRPTQTGYGGQSSNVTVETVSSGASQSSVSTVKDC